MRSLAWLPKMTAPCAPSRPATPLGHKHMAFSIVAPFPHATAIAVQDKGSRLYIYSTYLGISNCRRHSLAGWTRATEILHYAPNDSLPCPFPSIFFARVIWLRQGDSQTLPFPGCGEESFCAVSPVFIHTNAKFYQYYGTWSWPERRIPSAVLH